MWRAPSAFRKRKGKVHPSQSSSPLLLLALRLLLLLQNEYIYI